MSWPMQLFPIAGPTLETDDSLKPPLTTDGQAKVHLPSTVWKQPKDTKDWGDEYISKEQPERGKDMGQSRYSSADNIICEPSLAGKGRGEKMWPERLEAALTPGVSWWLLFTDADKQASYPCWERMLQSLQGFWCYYFWCYYCWPVPSENTQTCSAARTPIPLSKTGQVRGISGVADTVASYIGEKYNFCGKLDMNPWCGLFCLW